MTALRKRGTDIFLVSGGFTQVRHAARSSRILASTGAAEPCATGWCLPSVSCFCR
jgi:phosphoserine phosphatase